jgi:hypothetical protein
VFPAFLTSRIPMMPCTKPATMMIQTVRGEADRECDCSPEQSGLSLVDAIRHDDHRLSEHR